MNKQEINRLVAEKVMGWEYQDCNGDELLLPADGDASRLQFVKKPNRHAFVKDYSTDIRDAWLVFERFDFFHIERVTGYGEFYKVTLSVAQEDGTYQEIEAIAETAPLAICLAALKSVGVEVEVNG